MFPACSFAARLLAKRVHALTCCCLCVRRKIHCQRTFTRVEDQRQFFFWTTMAMRMKRVPGARMIKYDPPVPPVPPMPGESGNPGNPGKPLYNPAGFSESTVAAVLADAAPGTASFLEYMDKVCSQDANGGLGIAGAAGAGEGSSTSSSSGEPDAKRSKAAADCPFRVAACRKRLPVLDYSAAADRNVLAAMKEGTFLVDIFNSHFKSYMEMGRALLRLCAEPAVFAVLFAGFHLPMPLDWPARE